MDRTWHQLINGYGGFVALVLVLSGFGWLWLIGPLMVVAAYYGFCLARNFAMRPQAVPGPDEFPPHPLGAPLLKVSASSMTYNDVTMGRFVEYEYSPDGRVSVNDHDQMDVAMNRWFKPPLTFYGQGHYWPFVLLTIFMAFLGFGGQANNAPTIANPVVVLSILAVVGFGVAAGLFAVRRPITGARLDWHQYRYQPTHFHGAVLASAHAEVVTPDRRIDIDVTWDTTRVRGNASHHRTAAPPRQTSNHPNARKDDPRWAG